MPCNWTWDIQERSTRWPCICGILGGHQREICQFGRTGRYAAQLQESFPSLTSRYHSMKLYFSINTWDSCSHFFFVHSHGYFSLKFAQIVQISLSHVKYPYVYFLQSWSFLRVKCMWWQVMWNPCHIIFLDSIKLFYSQGQIILKLSSWELRQPVQANTAMWAEY